MLKKELEELEELEKQEYIVMPENINSLEQFKNWIMEQKIEENKH